jgi:type I restriction enzyme S subunit
VVVPTDWKFVELGAVVTTGQLGGNYPNSSVSDGLPLIKMGNLGRGKIDLSTRYFLARGFSPSSLDMLKPNDVLFNTRNTLDLVGKVAIWRNELPVACFNSNIMRLSFDSSVVCNEYANYALNTSVSIKALREMATGTTSVAAIYGRDLWLLPFLLPPLKEQKAIAEAISDADAAIESLDALITKKRDVKQATMQQLLTGRTRLPGFTADWKEVRLGDLGSCLRGVSYKGDSDLSDGDTPTTVRLLRSNNVQNSLIQFNDVQYVNHDCVSDEQILRRDDIVICMANGSKVLVGKTGLYKDSQDARYTFGAFMACFRSSSDQAHAVFIRYLFLTKQYQDYISNLLAGSSINNLTPKSIESLLFNVPPLKEQEAIAETLTVMDDELEALTEQVSKLRMVKEGMMQDLLTGKVRLV